SSGIRISPRATACYRVRPVTGCSPGSYCTMAGTTGSGSDRANSSAPHKDGLADDLSGVELFERAADLSIGIKVELRVDPRPKRGGEEEVNEPLELRAGPHGRPHDPQVPKEHPRQIRARIRRSEERRVGRGCGSRCW